MTRPARIPKTGVPGKSRPKAKDAPGRSVPKHLAWIRTLPCVAGNRWCKGPMQAAHVRNNLHPAAQRGGMGLKPGDQWSLPLCKWHHIDVQHAEGEVMFWACLGIDPVALAERLWRVSGDTEQGLRAIERARKVEAR